MKTGHIHIIFVDYVKVHVYRDKPEKAEALEAGIEELIRQIPADMSKRVCQN